MKFQVTPEDFLKGALVKQPNSWFPSVITGYEEKKSKQKMIGGQPDPNWVESTYAEVKFKITEGEDKGQVKYQNFSEKAPAFTVPLLEALGATVDRKTGYAGEISKEKLVGQYVDIHIVRGAWLGKPKDEIDGYKKFSGTKVADPNKVAGT